MTDLPTWEQRLRAPQLVAGSLIGPAISWAPRQSDRGVLLATPSGRTEVFAFDASTSPATLTQVTDRPDGTTGAAISPDGADVYWFDDVAGDELGRWCRASGAQTVTLLAELPPSYACGIVPLADRRALIGRMLDATDTGVGFELALAGPDGGGAVVYADQDPAAVVAVSHDEGLALVEYAPAGDLLHMVLRVVRLSDGAVVGELADPGRNLSGVGFHPSDPGRVLVGHEREDTSGVLVWDVATGAQQEVGTPLQGDVSATWYPDGSGLLVKALHDARHQLFRLDLASGELVPIPAPRGTVAAASARPDGSVHVLMSRSDLPVSLTRVHDGLITNLVVLDGPAPAATVAATDLHVEGPGGTVHALLCLPPAGVAPYPTVFLVHGGPTWQDYDAWTDRVPALVDAGYAVVRVNYRGSTGYGAAWRDALHGRLGFIELEDISAVRDHLEETGVVDPRRVCMVGASWGGFLTLMAVGTQPDRWRSGVALVPLADQFLAAEGAPSFMRAYDEALMGGSIEDIPDAYRASSPITYADDVVAPLYISAGENDPRCPVRQVDSYVARLRGRGHPVRYERHAVGHALPDVDMRVSEVRNILEFLAETLPVV